MKMVKRDFKSSISEDDGDGSILSKNGKRAATEAPSSDGKKRLKTKSLYRQPTVRELNRLQETETLFNSNLFRLQVEEILEEVKLKEKTAAKFQQWFETFKKHMNAISVKETEYDLSESAIFKELKVKSPISSELKKTKCVFKFHKFIDIKLIGSYALECSINSKLRVDLDITVPAETYTKNDSVNYRYDKKRAAYLACIASHLKEFEAIKDLQYTWLNGCESKPVLDFLPNGKLGNYLTVRLHLSCESEAYKPHRFSPTRNNLREAWLFVTEASENNANIDPPTPYYNSSILQDLTASVNHDFLKEVLSRSDNLKQAIVLLKIWLRQRNLKVSGHVVSMLVAHLVQTKRINNIMSSYQIVRNVWISLKSSEWDTKGISLHKGNDPTPPLEDFLQAFPVVFLDRTGHYNVTWQMSTGTYQALKRESSLAVDSLDNGSINSFIPLFMTPVTPILQFDHVLRFKDLQNVKASVYNAANKEFKLNYGVDHLALVSDSLHRLLTKGLGERVELLLQQIENDFSWSVKEGVEKAKRASNYKEKLSFGLILNPDHALNIVEKGPAANLPEAEQFRAFWGDKSELRRFQDGGITETCVWSADSLAERRMVTKQIVCYLLHLKFGISQQEIFYIGDQLDSVLARKQLVSHNGVIGTGEEDALGVIQAFDELRRDLRGLTEVPLDISSVYGTSPVFSYTCPLPPAAAPPPPRPRLRHRACLVKEFARGDGLLACPSYTPVSVAVVELTYSGKWPGDLQAFRCLKAAFHLQLAERLTQQYSLPAQAYPGFVDVLRNGYVFRLVIAHPKEITLVKREVEDGVVKYKDSDESLNLQRDTVLLPRLRGALHGLHQRHPAYGPAVSLLKRWLCAHLLDNHHFPETVAELLVAYTVLRAAPLTPTTQPMTAFLRALHLLANTDWATEMLIVDFNEDISREQQAELERSFSSRDPSASPAMRVVTSHDGGAPGVWCARAPGVRVLARARALARAALDHVGGALEVHEDNVLGIFVPSLAGYDVIIRLRPHLVPHSAERLQLPACGARATGDVARDVIPVADFSPVRDYLQELRSAYSEFALFFHDTYGGDIIAVLWKPSITEKIEFQVSSINATKRVKVDGEVKYAPNVEAIVADFRALGEDLIMDITVNT